MRRILIAFWKSGGVFEWLIHRFGDSTYADQALRNNIIGGIKVFRHAPVIHQAEG
jgi:hypothetical protein